MLIDQSFVKELNKRWLTVPKPIINKFMYTNQIIHVAITNSTVYISVSSLPLHYSYYYLTGSSDIYYYVLLHIIDYYS